MLARQHGLTRTERQARELISGPSPAAKTRLLSFNTMESRVVTGLLTEHNTLRRHFYTMELIDSPLCRRCGAEEETAAHVLCECEALATLGHTHLGSSFLDPEDVRNLSLGESGTFLKGQGSHDLEFSLMVTKGLSKAYVHRDRKGSNPLSILLLH